MIVIVGHGPSILSGLGSVIDTATVIRLKHGRAGLPVHWGTRTDFICGRALWYAKPPVPFWHFGSQREERWMAFYRKFSNQKPSHGLCATFCAIDELKPEEIHYIGCDSMLDPAITFRKWSSPHIWANPHDWRAEREALNNLDIKVKDLRNV